jgi:catechol 2,3-dioxygenase-like lactoylglutathione lyase family enzyme
MSALGLQVSLIVKDYDEAIQFFVHKLGFQLLADEPAVTSHSKTPKRWVVVRPPGVHVGGQILLARAEGEEQQAAIGRQWAGRVGMFWQVEDFEDTYRKMQQVGVEFVEQPRAEAYGKVVVFKDVSGNKWDLLG